MRGNNPMSWLKLQWKWKYHKPPQTMTWTTTNDDMNHHKSPQITINHHKFTMTWITTNHKSLQITTNHDINHHEPWQKPARNMTRIIMMTKKELCLEPYGFLVGLWSRICIFRGEQTKHNYQEKGIKIFTNGVVVYNGLAWQIIICDWMVSMTNHW